MATAVHPTGFETIRREELARLLRRFAVLRSLLMPVTVATIIYVAYHDHAWLRRVAMAAVAGMFVAITVHERWKLAHSGEYRYAPTPNDKLLSAVFLGLVAVTGGIYSPFALQALVAVPIVVVTFGASRARRATALVFVGFATLALLQLRGHAVVPRPFMDTAGRLSLSHTVCFSATMLILIAFAFRFGAGMTDMSDRMLDRSLRARDELLRSHEEQLRALTTLSGEIAHELKNPLASIKGLAQLLEVDPARAPERLRVLRGEIDRMQGILDEFLNFSRPLVPLSQSQVNLTELCREVVELHEGMTSGRALALLLPANEALEIRCDRRKLKQVLINLVQNALEASPKGSDVQVSLDRRADFARLRVLDRGPGLPEELRERAFDAGVTSKARGSGLGLTIVRMLAEQHGGSVDLTNRQGGGCVAEVLLPIAGAPDRTP